MGTTQPIRDKKDIKNLKQYFLDKGEIRNYALIVIGLNIPLRISDILNLQWQDVYNFDLLKYRSHIIIIERKTKKKAMFILNKSVITCLEQYMDTQLNVFPNEYIFRASKAENKPISRITAYIVIKKAAMNLGLESISCHSLRKTFGYHAWKKGVHLALIMSIYNHSSIQVTKRYLGIEQEDKDIVFQNLNL